MSQTRSQRQNRPAPATESTEAAESNGTPDATATAEVQACGTEYPRTVKGKTVQGKCGKPKGHDGEHGRKPVTQSTEPDVPMDVLDTYEAVPSDEVVTVKADNTERSENQKKVDAQVKDSHESWVVAGRPKAFNDAPRKRYMLNPEHVAGMIKMLRRAERLHGVRVRIAPVKAHESGKSMLYWVAVDKKEAASANGQGGAPTLTEAEEAAQSA